MKKTFNIFFMIFLIIGLSSIIQAIEVTETVSGTVIQPGGILSITYTPKDYQNRVGWVVSREIPEGWEITEEPGGMIIEGQKFAYLGVNANPLTIKIKAPTTGQTYDFPKGSWAIIDILEDNTEEKNQGSFPVLFISTNNTIVCATDVYTCPDGTILTRDPKNNCEFPKCPGSNIFDKLPPLTGDSTLDMIIWIFIGLFALMLIINMIPSKR